MSRLLRTLAILILVCLAGVAGAQSRPGAAIRYRQGLMAAIGWNFDLLGTMVRRGPFDAKEFASRAERLAAFGPQIMEGFPKPTDADKGAVTDAAKEIWSDAAGFQARVDEYIAESRKLADAAKSGDEAQMKAQYRKLSDTCKACHDTYKAD